MRRLAPLALCLPVVLMSCAGIVDSGGQGGGGDVTGVTWVLDQASMMTLVDSVPKKAQIDITFDGSHASGLAACNQYGGGYEADADTGAMTFSTLSSTAMGCVDDLMGLESAYLKALGDVTGYQVIGDQSGLQLTGGTAALTFRPAEPVESLPLEATDWTLTTLATADTQAVSSTVAGTNVTALFDAGTVSGSGGCNDYHAGYQTDDGGGLTIDPVAATQKLCAGDVSDQELAYFTALGTVASYTIAGDQLTLSDAAGNLVLQFTGTPVR
jgi:heat shock protein HslJ